MILLIYLVVAYIFLLVHFHVSMYQLYKNMALFHHYKYNTYGIDIKLFKDVIVSKIINYQCIIIVIQARHSKEAAARMYVNIFLKFLKPNWFLSISYPKRTEWNIFFLFVKHLRKDNMCCRFARLACQPILCCVVTFCF